MKPVLNRSDIHDAFGQLSIANRVMTNGEIGKRFVTFDYRFYNHVSVIAMRVD
jgi:hypothetical protein